MRDVTRLERAIILLALYVWQWLEAVQEYVDIVQENRRGLRRGAADEDWQHTLRELAAPIREHRMARGDTEELTLAEWREATTSDRIDVVRDEPATPAPVAVGFDAANLDGPLVVVTGEGAVLTTTPHPVPVHKRNHRRPSRATKATALKEPHVAALRAAEQRIVRQLDRVVLEAMRAAGWSIEEARAILGAHHHESVFAKAYDGLVAA